MAEITLAHYLAVAAILFVFGVFGIFINRKNVITILMSIELILLSVSINLVAFSAFSSDLSGQIFSLFILTVAAAEAAIGLAILVVYFRNRGVDIGGRYQHDERVTRKCFIRPLFFCHCWALLRQDCFPAPAKFSGYCGVGLRRRVVFSVIFICVFTCCDWR